MKELLANRQANGIIFTTMQKFEESDEPSPSAEISLSWLMKRTVGSMA